MKHSFLRIESLVFILTFIHGFAIAQVKLPKDFEKQKKDEYNKLLQKEVTFEQYLESEKKTFEQVELLKTGKIQSYTSRLSNSVCNNGDFESGTINPLEWQGGYSDSDEQRCPGTFNPADPFCPSTCSCPSSCQFDGNAPCVNVNGFVSGIIPRTDIFNSEGHHTIVAASADPGGTPRANA